jgi:hypothetical protein
MSQSRERANALMEQQRLGSGFIEDEYAAEEADEIYDEEYERMRDERNDTE